MHNVTQHSDTLNRCSTSL